MGSCTADYPSATAWWAEPDATPVPIDFVEIDDQPGLSPEGRLALVEDWSADSPLLMGNLEHPNGALELIESVLCVPDSDLSAYERRYARYLQRPARSDGPLRVLPTSTPPE